MKPTLSVIIPAYNEEARIPATLHRVDEYLSASGQNYEILVVDDGSVDGTRRVVEEVSSVRPRVRCLSYRINRGKGHAVRVGMSSAQGSIRLMMDADCSVGPEEMPRLVNRVRLGQADIAIGSRYAHGAAVKKKQPRYRIWWSRLCNRVIQKTLVGGISDTQCGFKAFSAEAAQEIFSQARIDGWAFDLEILALARHLDYKIAEEPVSWSDDPRSKINPIKDAIRVITEWYSIRSNFKQGVYLRENSPAHLPCESGVH